MIRLRRLLVIPLMLMVGVTEAATQQAQGITGRVVNAETLAPLAGVLISVDGNNTAVLTGADGRFTIQAPGTATLIFRMIGFAETRVEVENRAVVNVSLQSSALLLDEVVAVGYGTQTRATVSGAVSSVTAEQIETSTFTTTADALAGLVQGVNIRMMTSDGTAHTAGQSATGGTGGQIAGNPNDGRPGSTSTLQIRNMGAPLFVIDGVPSSSAEFNHLNAADIENISILKDASAAVYGFRAANGVVLVTTKKGSRVAAPRVSINGAYGWQNPTRYHFERTLDAYEYLFGVADSEANRNQPKSMSREELELWRLGGPGFESTDHYPLVMNNPNAPQYNLNASVSGGMENASYYLSLGHVQQDYNIRDFTWGRTNLAANLQVSLSSRMTIGTELRAQNAVRDEVALLGDQDAVRTALLAAHSSWPHEQPWTGPNNDLVNFNVRYLVRSVAMNSREISGWSQDIRRQASGNFWAQYEFPFGTTVRGTYSAQANTRDYDLARRSFDAYCHDTATNTYNICHNSGDRTRQQLRNKEDGDFVNVTVNHSQQLGIHSLAGATFLEMDGSENTTTYLIGQSPTNYTHLIEQARVTEIGNSWGISRRSSVGGRLDYDYDKKYLLSALGRYDGSYLFAPGKRWGFFPGISLGWRITEEPFLRDRVGFLDDLKLRASWGQTGREQLPNNNANWSYLGGATYGVGGGAVLDGVMLQGTRPRGVPITNLSWVTSTSKNVGVDVLMLNGRLTLEADLFERLLTGLPAPRSDVLLPTELGYTLPNENLNSDVTRGFEAALTYGNNAGRVRYSVSPNVTVARSAPVSRYMQRFSSSWNEYASGGRVGRWEGTNFGYEVIGQFKSMEEIERHPVMFDGQGNQNLLPGDLIFKDVNGDGIINAMDQRPIGFGINQTPIVSFGAGTRLSFEGITVTTNLAGGAMYSHNRDFEMRYLSQGGHNMAKYAIDRWHRVDPYNPQSEWIPGRYPPLRIGGTGGTHPSNSLNSTFWRTNVKFLRVRRVEVAYNLPDRLPQRVGLSGVRLFTNMSNPVSFDNTKHYSMDPEVTQNNGIVYPTIQLLNTGFSANVGSSPRPSVPVPVVPS